MSEIFNNGEFLDFYKSSFADIKRIIMLALIILSSNKLDRLSDFEKGMLPGEIVKYKKFFDEDSNIIENGIKTESLPKEYPHDWLEELKDYEYKNGIFAKKKRGILWNT